jgi:hypothetical protein
LRIPLLIAGCPKEVSPCEIFLFEGSYDIVVEGVVDSLLSLLLGSNIFNITDKLNIPIGCKAKLNFDKVGTEKAISVYVDKC